MNAADAMNLATGSLAWIMAEVESANNDEDADPWLVLEDIQIRAENILAYLTDAGFHKAATS